MKLYRVSRSPYPKAAQGLGPLQLEELDVVGEAAGPLVKVRGRDGSERKLRRDRFSSTPRLAVQVYVEAELDGIERLANSPTVRAAGANFWPSARKEILAALALLEEPKP